MMLTVHPTGRIEGRIRLPASKSYSIRAFIIAACGGRSRVIAPSDCDDAKVALTVARNLGACCQRLSANQWQIQPATKRKKTATIHVGESGTALRFLLPLLPFSYTAAEVVGRGTLLGRPNRHLTTLLRQQGLDICGEGEAEGVPIHFRGGQLRGGTMTIDGSLSSQFISALLIACPRLNEDVVLKIAGRTLVSTEYIAMTRQILAKSGIEVQRVDDRTYRIPGQQKFRGLKNFTVPSDYGLAAFPMAAGLLLPSDLILEGYFPDDLVQADGYILKFLTQMGTRFTHTRQGIRLKGPQRLKGGRFSLKDCPDLVPIMAVLALFAQGKTVLTDIHHARAKESDRISDLRRELLKIGADVAEQSNGLVIMPQPVYKNNVELDPHHDHRLAMAFAVLGLKVGARIKDSECVAKSYPGFVRDMKKLKAQVSPTS